MVTQPETLSFGPQWIRKLSDFAPGSQRPSSIGAVDSLPKAIVLPSDTGDKSVSDGLKCQNSIDVPYYERNHDPKPDGDEAPEAPPDVSAAWNSTTAPTIHQAWHGQSVIGPPRPLDSTPETYSWDAPAAHYRNSVISELRTNDLNGSRNISNDMDGSVYSSTQTAESSLLGRREIATESSSEANAFQTSLWDQQHRLWSKSVPQHLHGLESTGLQPDTLPSLLNRRHVADSFPGAEKSPSALPNSLLSFVPSDHPAPFHTTASQSDGFPVLENERNSFGPDCSDQPDEHLWFYEDPQGRTQGSFTDSQMNDWLSAGIYFTSNLRIRRKCDSEFSTLADYTSFFGRIPFIKGPRVPPISGGITAAMLKGTSKESISMSSVERCTSNNQTSVDSAHSTVSDTSISHTNGLVPTLSSHVSNCQSNFQVSVACPLTSLDPRAPVPLHDSNQSHIPKTLSTGVCANSSLPVMQSRPQLPQVTSLPHSFGGLNISGQSNFDSNSHLIGCTAQPTVSPSTLMALASLISVNPALASLALSFSGQSQLSSIPDLRTTAMTPGFLTALAQYLNVQPYGSGHTQVSPMQQLAETAQLAAQLAAMASAYSPDQTPMQPAQALALAELVRSQANPWPLPARKNSIDDTNQCTAVEASDRQMDGSSSGLNNANNRLLPGVSHSIGSHSLTSGGDPRLVAQSIWPSLHSMNDNGPTHNSPRRTDGFLLSSHTTISGEEMSSDRLRDGVSHFSQHSVSSHQTSKRQSQTVSASIGTHTSLAKMKSQSRQANDAFGSANGSTDSSTWRWTSDDAVTEKRPDDDRPITHTYSNASQTLSATHWANKVKQASSKPPSHSSPRTTTNNSETTRRTTPAVPTDNRVKGTGATTVHDNRNDTTNQSNSTSRLTVTALSTTPSPTKPTRSTPKVPAPVIGTVAISSATTVSSVSPASSLNSDVTAEQELRRLTEWCQTRLSAMPMREKVDIPTLVELLATLDAPYEVERMVQTFLNESTRTSLFVKDFLDQRRPFWQLHRERREKESAVKSVPRTEITKENVPRCNDKKRSSVGQLSGSTTNNLVVTGCNGGTGWTKVVTAQATTANDTQWHHIKPKGNHNRRGKKDKSS